MAEKQHLTSEYDEGWKGVIIKFLADKYEADFAKYLKILFKKIGNTYKKEDFFNNENLAFIFDNRKNKKNDEQKETAFILEQITLLKEFSEKPISINFESLHNDINAKNQFLVSKYAPETWITWASENAKNVTFATHVTKLTHSIIDSPSLFSATEAAKNTHLSTASLANVAIDGAVQGNQYSPIYQFLELEVSGKKLVSEFVSLDTGLLESFAKNHEQLQIWNQGFAAATSRGKPRAHFLLKQTYFPISTASLSIHYHLLCNVVSSSKAQALFEFSRRNSKNAFKIKNSNKYSEETYFNFPNRASISITASNHGNASQLNGKRGGRLGLFSCQPPVWHSQLKAPIYKTNFFYELSRNYEVKENIQYLSDFLTRFENLQLSIKDPKRMRWVEQWIENLADEVLVYVKTIQALPVGWSVTEDIKLKPEHQVLLDCYRQDEEFITMKNNSDWQAVITQDFASWLNNRLAKTCEKFTPQDSHSKLWKKIFKANFREEFDEKRLTQQEKTV
ncbi:type I-F CRISPR-associated protein Csy1 [Vibrio sp. 10N.286.49.B3]|uniref:type I-F CRISPR-associated protein Csy1 n=1 Tax=Vibrio sp. 10N.286.49.B3 TaxID=1880855 RepID=UPI000C84FBE4|nr:type I-F CRISPR-associated protein Csy1 [Vibrio sp. 10N.286.49.B3]PMH37113.1 type I-F CRISPR-associated protein Csy1 [Vibrio sp. 10N.286.49.B3]